uniref:Uncharacterized protein n=1 Tax=Oryza meridionalis TaxID=40149 RepID=A0A0E0DWN9_9ORYZ
MSGVQNTAEDRLPDGGASELSTKTSIVSYSDETRRSLPATRTAFNLWATSAIDGLSSPLERCCEALVIAIVAVDRRLPSYQLQQHDAEAVHVALLRSCRYSGSRYPRVPCTIVISWTASLGSHRDAPKSVTFTV